MATVTGYTAERMLEIENTTVVDGSVDGSGDLILETREGTLINAGSVIGPAGPPGTDTAIEVVTSGTRPTGGALFEGLGIYETDTERFYMYDGAAWRYRGGLWLCTAATRPSAPFDGLEIWETDTKKRYVYDGTQWVLIFQRDVTTYTPTFLQGATTITKTVNHASYRRRAKRISLLVKMTATGAGPAGSLVTVSLPVAIADLHSLVGAGHYIDVGNTNYGITCEPQDVNTLQFQVASGNNGLGAQAAMAVASGDIIRFSCEYEAAAF